MRGSSNHLVSVWMITYNHEKYIRQALESVFMQQTDFYFDVVIGEDASTDNTRTIIDEFKREYGERLITVYHDTNVGYLRNAYEFCFPLLKGKYVAVLEGDDYWTDPLKLQKQVDFLEKNPEFSLCHHAFDVDYEDKIPGIKDRNRYNREKPVITFTDILDFSYPKSLTVIFRRDILSDIDLNKFFRDMPVGDIPLWHLILLKGKGFFIDEAMGCYRVHGKSLTNTRLLMQNELSSGMIIWSRILILEKIISNKLFEDKTLLRAYLSKNYIRLAFLMNNPYYVLKSLFNKLLSSFHWPIQLTKYSKVSVAVIISVFFQIIIAKLKSHFLFFTGK